jgi:hypothetical protein
MLRGLSTKDTRRTSFNELDEVLRGGSELRSDRQLFQRKHHRSARVLAILSMGEDVTELRVCKLVEAASGVH